MAAIAQLLLVASDVLQKGVQLGEHLGTAFDHALVHLEGRHWKVRKVGSPLLLPQPVTEDEAIHSAVDNLLTADKTRASQMLGKQATIEF